MIGIVRPSVKTAGKEVVMTLDSDSFSAARNLADVAGGAYWTLVQ
jgi:hypothetical protein